MTEKRIAEFHALINEDRETVGRKVQVDAEVVSSSVGSMNEAQKALSEHEPGSPWPWFLRYNMTELSKSLNGIPYHAPDTPYPTTKSDPVTPEFQQAAEPQKHSTYAQQQREVAAQPRRRPGQRAR